MSTHAPAPIDEQDELHPLLDDHARISGWLARLEEVTLEVPEAATRLVRGDYEERLAETIAALSEQAIELRDAAAEAVKRIAAARDRIPELRLRHAVGELDHAALTQRLTALQREATDAENERSRLTAKLNRIEAAIGKVDGHARGSRVRRSPPPTTKETAGGKAEPMDDAFGEWQGPGRADADGEKTPPDDLGFLDSLPRSPGVLNRTQDPRPVRSQVGKNPADPASEEARRLECPSCDFQNETTAWYCDKCGAELG